MRTLPLLALTGPAGDPLSPEDSRALNYKIARDRAIQIAPNGKRSVAATDAMIAERRQGLWGQYAPAWVGGAPGFSSADPRAVRNNNPMNLSYAPGQGTIGSDGRFGVYASLTDGVAAAERQLLMYQDGGFNTLSKIINRWAPPSENDTQKYIDTVSKSTGFVPNTPLNMRDPDQAQRVIAAMTRWESGRPIDGRALQAGIDQGLNSSAVPPGLVMPGIGGSDGKVQVDVTLRGAPPGSSMNVTSSGIAAATARTVTPMRGW